MREILLNYGYLVLWVVCVLELLLTMLLFSDYSKKKDPIILCMALIGVGMCFDAVILAAGRFMMLPILRVLSQGRFILHGILIPLNLMICAYSAPFYKRARVLMWVLTTLMMIAGAGAGAFRELDVQYIHQGAFNQIVRYASVSPKTAWMERINTVISFGTTIPVILTGIWVTIKQKAPEILLAGVLMFLFSALGPATGNADLIFIISMFGELLMLFFFMLYEKHHVSKMYDYYH